jgi:hypothetical protein
MDRLLMSLEVASALWMLRIVNGTTVDCFAVVSMGIRLEL